MIAVSNNGMALQFASKYKEEVSSTTRVHRHVRNG